MRRLLLVSGAQRKRRKKKRLAAKAALHLILVVGVPLLFVTSSAEQVQAKHTLAVKVRLLRFWNSTSGILVMSNAVYVVALIQVQILFSKTAKGSGAIPPFAIKNLARGPHKAAHAMCVREYRWVAFTQESN